MRTYLAGLVLGLGIVGSLGACSGSADDAVTSGAADRQALVFHGQIEALPGFSFDTGYLPAGSPVQVRFVASAVGSLTADARAHAGGSAFAPAVVAEPGSGNLVMDGHLSLKAYLKV